MVKEKEPDISSMCPLSTISIVLHINTISKIYSVAIHEIGPI